MGIAFLENLARRPLSPARWSCEFSAIAQGADLLFDFEPFAEAYVRVSEGNGYNAHYERPAIRSLLPRDLSGLRFLDAGCAGGPSTEYLADRGGIVTGLDVSPTMVRLARLRLRNRAEVVHADLREKLALPDASFDVVICSLTMHYIRDWDPIVAEFHRVLRPGGRLILSTNHPSAEFCRSGSIEPDEITLVEQVWTDFGKVPILARFYTRPLSMIQASLETAGFQVNEVVSPQPSKDLAVSEPALHHKLSHEPWFVVLSASATV